MSNRHRLFTVNDEIVNFLIRNNLSKLNKLKNDLIGTVLGALFAIKLS